MNDALSCLWCERPFRPRRSGGRAQRFCRPSCRRAFHAAVRVWALDELAGGRVTVANFKNGPHATRTLVPASSSVSPVLGAPREHAGAQASADEAAQQEPSREIPAKTCTAKIL
jgi:hypothetical protein